MQTADQVVQFNWSLPYFTNIPGDVVVNTWHMIYDAGGTIPGPVQYALAADRLTTFYNAVYASVAMGLWCNKAGVTVKAYRLWDPPPHIPVYEAVKPVTTTALAGVSPTESSICMSYKADYISGVPIARQRGRVFLGGFANPCASGSASAFPEITSAQRTAICNAASALRTGLLADDWLWVVLSPTQVSLNAQETFAVEGGWVDNTPDTQRRRGVSATARTIW